MNILEPEPERTLEEFNFKKIVNSLSNIFTKIGKDKYKYDKVDSHTNISYDKHIFKLNDKFVREIMTSRKDTFMVNIDDDINSILDSLANTKYSKIPIYENSIDNIIGILYVDELLRKSKEEVINNFKIRNSLYKPNYIPETTIVNELFNSIDKDKEQIFILIDEYGGFSGIVTIDDLIYEIKGLTYDKDLKHSKIKKIDENNYIVKGFLTVSDFNEIFNADIEQGDYDTLNGYIISKLGQIPTQDEAIQINLGKLIFTLIKIRNKRIEDIQVSIVN